MNVSPVVVRNTLQRSTKHGLSDTDAVYLMRLVFEVTKKSLICMPKVFFMGFPRSGSTQLYKMLMLHPGLEGGEIKETHWWTKSERQFQKFPHNVLGIVHYLSNFRHAFSYIEENPDTLLIDGSQSTIWDTRKLRNLCFLPELFSKVLPGSKYIVLMRDPVERMYSDFKYLCEESWRKKHLMEVPKDFEAFGSSIFHEKAVAEITALTKCLESRDSSLEQCAHDRLVGFGDTLCGRVRLGVNLYHVHIRRWLREIPREQFLFLRTDELASSPLQLLKEVWHFLKVREQSEEELSDILHEHLHQSHAAKAKNAGMKEETQRMLRTFFQPHNQALADLLNDDRFKWENK